jgi:5-methylcytosine-specific restriction endonuclease McrA
MKKKPIKSNKKKKPLFVPKSRERLILEGFTEKQIEEYYKAHKKPYKVKPIFNAKKYKRTYYKYLLSDEWQQIRNELFESRGRNCEICHSTKFLQIHHKTYKRVFREDPADLIIVCRTCHEKIHEID